VPVRAPLQRLNLVARIPIVDVQAKDRLTGAIILVVLVVLLVPELLSGPGIKVAAVAPVATDAPPLRSYTMELGDESRTHRAASPGLASAAPAVALPPPPPPPAPAVAPPRDAPAPKEAATVASPPPSAAAPQPAAPGGWTVQLGSFASRANAERLVRELKGKGYASFWTESASGGRKFYRVRVGPATDHAAAEALAVKLRAAGHSGSLTQRP
jgi:DedD protein